MIVAVERLVVIQTELAAIAPASFTRFLFPLARTTSEPLSSQDTTDTPKD